MRDHFKRRIHIFQWPRQNDMCYLDTFFSSVPASVRGYRCFNLFAWKNSKYDFPVLMHRRSQALSSLEDCLSKCGVMTELKSDNAPEFTSKKFQAKLKMLCINQSFTEPHHQNENVAEPRGGNLKAATVHVLTCTKAPKELWCYALEYTALVRSI